MTDLERVPTIVTLDADSVTFWVNVLRVGLVSYWRYYDGCFHRDAVRGEAEHAGIDVSLDGDDFF